LPDAAGTRLCQTSYTERVVSTFCRVRFVAETTPAKIPVSLLLARPFVVEVRRLAERDDLSLADVIRGLLRRGLAAERSHGDEAA
jgi:hypothetical protein